MNFKDIHIGSLIAQKTSENEIEKKRICNFLKCTEEEIQKMFLSKSLDSELLLKWSKLLEYDFFRIYNQHLILYSPVSTIEKKSPSPKTLLPSFRKNIYTREMIDFILDQINIGSKTKNQVVEEYRIPKTTLYKWISKYKK